MVPITGEPFVWAAFVLPIFAGFFALNLASGPYPLLSTLATRSLLALDNPDLDGRRVESILHITNGNDLTEKPRFPKFHRPSRTFPELSLDRRQSGKFARLRNTITADNKQNA
jgi:hypothetical protein